MELIHIANATFSSSRIKINHSLENLASKTKLTGLLKSTRSSPAALVRFGPGARSAEPARQVGSHHRASSRHRADVQRSAGEWWSQPGSNRRPSGCKPDALPAELWPPSIGENRRDDFRETLHDFRGPRERPWARCASSDTGGSGRSCTSDLTLIRGAL
jgi:hypothetical protein